MDLLGEMYVILTSDPVSGSFFKLIVAEFLFALRVVDAIGKFLLFEAILKYAVDMSEGSTGSEKYKVIEFLSKAAELRILFARSFEVS